MATAIETRILSGLGHEADVDWLDFLEDCFRDLPITGLIHYGMSIPDARRLTGILALTARYKEQLNAQQ